MCDLTLQWVTKAAVVVMVVATNWTDASVRDHQLAHMLATNQIRRFVCRFSH